MDDFILSKNRQCLQDFFASTVIKKVIVGLDLEKSSDPRSTDGLLIYLSDQNWGSFETSFFVVWKIYGFKETPQAKEELCFSLNFSYRDPSNKAKLPDKNSFDRRDFDDFGPERIVNNPKAGFKNAIGQSILNVDLNLVDDLPQMRLDLTGCEYLYTININIIDDIEDKIGFFLNIYYD